MTSGDRPTSEWDIRSGSCDIRSRPGSRSGDSLVAKWKAAGAGEGQA
jgi:hypothetical protein